MWFCHIEDEIFQKMNRSRRHLQWETVLFDLEFLEHFGYTHWSELSERKEQTGFFLTERNIIEIKQGSKRLSRFYANELIENNLLFPLYHTIETRLNSIDDSSLIILEYETGLVMSFTIETEKLIMNDLTFELSSIQGAMTLSGLRNKDELLHSTISDTVVRRSLIKLDYPSSLTK